MENINELTLKEYTGITKYLRYLATLLTFAGICEILITIIKAEEIETTLMEPASKLIIAVLELVIFKNMSSYDLKTNHFEMAYSFQIKCLVLIAIDGFGGLLLDTFINSIADMFVIVVIDLVIKTCIIVLSLLAFKHIYCGISDFFSVEDKKSAITVKLVWNFMVVAFVTDVLVDICIWAGKAPAVCVYISLIFILAWIFYTNVYLRRLIAYLRKI